MATITSGGATGQAGGSAAAAAATPSAAVQLAGDVQTFLKMLTTQLQNQDPTQPLDPNQFTAQLAQFSAVEQQIAVNQHLDALIALQRSSNMLSAASLVGREVEVESGSLALRSGQAQALQLPAADGTAKAARISVANQAGQVVREALVPLGGVGGTWAWDGRDGNGRAVADGDYKVAVTGVDAAGTARGPLGFTLAGTVTGVARSGDQATLSLGALGIGLDGLRAVRK
jgi:flagellar basal-body rod modification protein FlgD